jgi:hypothetical protein
MTMIAGGLSLTTVSAPARDDAQLRNDQTDVRIAFTWPWSNRLPDEINHLNRMRGHVRWLFRNSRSKPQTRRDFFTVSHEIDRINAQFKQGGFNRHQLQRDVANAHVELHRIEVALNTKPRDYYLWR